MDEHGAFAVPSQAGLRGMIPFQDWPRIDITFLLSATVAKKLVNPVEFYSDYIVVIISPSVSRDPSALFCSRGSVGRVALEIT